MERAQYLLNERGVIKHVSSAMIAPNEPRLFPLAMYKAKEAFDE